MSDGKIFTKDTKKFLSDVICDELELKGVFKLFKMPIVNSVLNLVDTYGDKYIPDRFDPKINDIAVLCGNGEWIDAAELAGQVADGEINLPGDQNTKSKLIINGFKFGASLIIHWIEKKKG